MDRLGVSPKLGCYDVYSIDEPELLSFIPRPAYALTFMCPGEVYMRAREADQIDNMEEYTASGPKEPVMWCKQTIGNSCGSMALLHGISNGTTREYVTPGSDLDKLISEAVSLPPTERAKLVYDSSLFEDAHRSAAQKGDTAVLAPTVKYQFHFISFVKGSDGHVWELDGGLKGPIDRGVLEEHEDMLSEKALELGVRRFIRQAAAGDGANALSFSIVALAPSME